MTAITKKRLNSKHIKTQFFLLIFSFFLFLGFALTTSTMSWMTNFRKIFMILSGMFAIFSGMIAILRYTASKRDAKYLFLGTGFIVVGILDLVSIINGLDIIPGYTTETNSVYPIQQIYSKILVSFLIFLSWFFSTKDKKENSRTEVYIISSVIFIAMFFITLIILFSDAHLLSTATISAIISVASMIFLAISFLGYLFRRDWRYSDMDFWLLFGISFLFLSQLFYSSILDLPYEGMLNLSAFAQFFGFLTFLVGFLSSINELYKNELELVEKLEKQNEELRKSKRVVKKKIEKNKVINKKS